MTIATGETRGGLAVPEGRLEISSIARDRLEPEDCAFASTMSQVQPHPLQHLEGNLAKIGQIKHRNWLVTRQTDAVRN